MKAGYFGILVSMIVCCHKAEAVETAQLVEFEASEWFDRLDVPSIAGKPFVSVSVRDSSGDAQLKAFGFMLTRYQNIYSILTTDLRQIRVPLSEEPSKISIDEANLEDYARMVLTDVKLYDNESPLGFCWEMGIEFRAARQPLTMSPSARDFFLARACFAHGHKTIGEQLARRSIETKRGFNRGRQPLRAEIETELYLVFMDRSRASLTNVGVGREEVLASLEWILNSLRSPYDPEEASTMVRVLRRMVQEDRSWRPDRPRMEKATAEELVYDLRNQTAVDWDAAEMPGYLTPAEQLLELGEKAVPVLIEAMGDQRLTRTAIDTGSVYPKLRVATIGEYAITILEELAEERIPTACAPSLRNAEETSRKQEELRRFWGIRGDMNQRD